MPKAFGSLSFAFGEKGPSGDEVKTAVESGSLESISDLMEVRMIKVHFGDSSSGERERRFSSTA